MVAQVDYLGENVLKPRSQHDRRGDIPASPAGNPFPNPLDPTLSRSLEFLLQGLQLVVLLVPVMVHA